VTESKETKEDLNPLEKKALVIDVKAVCQIIVRLSTSKSPRTVKDAMTVSELRALADCAAAWIKSIPSTPKPNGLTDEGRVIVQLEADVAHTYLRLEEALARVEELEKKIAKSAEER
jgi:hypothetical protein